MPEHSKEIKRLIRAHAAVAHEEELRRALLPLADAFDRWRRGETSSEELSGLIHEFHHGRAREIWKTYHQHDLTLAVVSALRQGILQRENVPAALLEALGPTLAFFDSLPTEKWDEEPVEE